MNIKQLLSILLFCTVSIFFNNILTAGKIKDTPGKLTVFTEDGQKFTLYVNGVKVNPNAAAIVEAKDIKGLTVKVSVVFENLSLGLVSKTVTRLAKDCSYLVSKNNKGVYEINMKTAGTLGSGPTIGAPDKTDSVINTIVAKTDSISKQPVISKPSGTTTLAQTDASKSQVMVNGRPADASVKVDNATGKVTLGATNDKGEGAKITIDPNKLGDIKNGTGFHEPQLKLGGKSTDEFSNDMDKAGNEIGNSIGNDLSELNKNEKTANPAISNTNSNTSTERTANTMPQQMVQMQKETEDAATAAMERAANPKTVLPGTFTFTSEDGEKFTLFISNKQQNTSAQSSVVVNNVLLTSVPVKIVFSDASIPPLEKKLFRMGKDCDYSIKKGKKGEYGIKIKSTSGSIYAE